MEGIRQLEAAAEAIRADIAVRVDTAGERFRLELEGQSYTVRGEAGACLRRILIEATHTSPGRRVLRLGGFAGFALEACVQRGFAPELVLRGQYEYTARVELEDSSSAGNLQTLENLPRRMEATLARTEQNLRHLRQQLTELEALSHTRFEQDEAHERSLARQRELEAILAEQPEDRRVDLASLEVAEAEADEPEPPDPADTE